MNAFIIQDGSLINRILLLNKKLTLPNLHMVFFLLTVGKTDNTFIEEQICKKISKRVLET